MIDILTGFFDRSKAKLKTTEKILKAIRDLDSEIQSKTYENLKDRVNEMRAEIKTLVDKIPDSEKKSLVKVNRREKFPVLEKTVKDKILEFMPEFYAMMNEVYRRESGSGYFDVQLKAAIILAADQTLVELYTGEGKTRTFQLPLALYSLAGRGAHLVTVNNYLTKVGAEYAGHFLNKLGITVGAICPEGSFRFIDDSEIEKYKGKEALTQRQSQHLQIDAMQGINLSEVTKKEAYLCDVTYSTNNELGFDYLRDNMAWDLGKIVQRELYFCIIDEADSILIDEARTPLIISTTPTTSDTEKYSLFAAAVKELTENVEYIVDHKSHSVNLTEEGIIRVENLLKVDNLWEDFAMAYHIENALKAKALYIKDDQYIVRNGQVLIVDEFTGRILDGRRYSEGLHQAIEAKEGVKIQEETKTFATITFQNFFRLYKILCGGSGSVVTESEEFYKIYGLDCITIPTNKPNIRVDHSDRIFKTSDAKFRAVVDEIKEMYEKGRPVLVGTTSVEKSELISRMLDADGIPHEVLNAKFHEQESRIVTLAGRKSAVTVATNMAGRGTDIIIGGGERGDEAYNEVYELGGLHVIGTERHDSRRIDNQLRGRTARQGEPGSTRFYASLDDQIMRILGGEIMQRLLSMIRVPDDMPIEMGVISKQIEIAQKRIESINFDSRKRVVEYDDVMNNHREIFYTRRLDVMETAENAMGRIFDGTRVVDVNLPEHKDKLELHKQQIEAKREKLEILMENLVLEEVEAAVFKNIPEGSKLSEDEIGAVMNKITKIVPTDFIVKDLKARNEKEIVSELYKKFSDGVDPQDFFIKKAEEAYDVKFKDFGNEFYYISKMISLETLDNKWVDHLEIMKDVRDSVSLQGYAQRTPIIEYKNSAFQMFDSFIKGINTEIAAKFFRLARVEKTEAQRQIMTNQSDIEDVLTGDREILPGENYQKLDKAISKIQQGADKAQRSLITNSSEQRSRTKVNAKSYGRNDKVTVKYSDGKIVKGVKYKKVEADVSAGNATII